RARTKPPTRYTAWPATVNCWASRVSAVFTPTSPSIVPKPWRGRARRPAAGTGGKPQDRSLRRRGVAGGGLAHAPHRTARGRGRGAGGAGGRVLAPAGGSGGA